MHLFEFTIVIDPYVDDVDAIDGFYGDVDDASIAESEGETLIHFDREASSLDEALRSATADVVRHGWQVRQILVEPSCVLTASD